MRPTAEDKERAYEFLLEVELDEIEAVILSDKVPGDEPEVSNAEYQYPPDLLPEEDRRIGLAKIIETIEELRQEEIEARNTVAQADNTEGCLALDRQADIFNAKAVLRYFEAMSFQPSPSQIARLENCFQIPAAPSNGGKEQPATKEDIKTILEGHDEIKQAGKAGHEETQEQARKLAKGSEALLVARTQTKGDRPQGRMPFHSKELRMDRVADYRKWEKLNPTVKRDDKKRTYILEKNPSIEETNTTRIDAKTARLKKDIDAVRNK